MNTHKPRLKYLPIRQSPRLETNHGTGKHNPARSSELTVFICSWIFTNTPSYFHTSHTAHHLPRRACPRDPPACPRRSGKAKPAAIRRLQAARYAVSLPAAPSLLDEQEEPTTEVSRPFFSHPSSPHCNIDSSVLLYLNQSADELIHHKDARSGDVRSS